MVLLNLLSYVGIVAGFVTLVFVVATVLYDVSEQLEEHTVLAKRYITRYIYGVLVAHALLWMDGLPLWPSVLSMATNYVYLTVMKGFPIVEFSSPSFVLSCIGAIVTHFMWFRYFNRDDLPPYSIYTRVPTYQGETLAPFSQIASFFGLLVWMVPLMLFLSLNVNDNVLPTTAEPTVRPVKRRGLARSAIDSVYRYVCETLKAFGFKTPQRDLPLQH